MSSLPSVTRGEPTYQVLLAVLELLWLLRTKLLSGQMADIFSRLGFIGLELHISSSHRMNWTNFVIIFHHWAGREAAELQLDSNASRKPRSPYCGWMAQWGFGSRWQSWHWSREFSLGHLYPLFMLHAYFFQYSFLFLLQTVCLVLLIVTFSKTNWSPPYLLPSHMDNVVLSA